METGHKQGHSETQTQELKVNVCDVLLIISICVHVPMSLWARTWASDGWLKILKEKMRAEVLDMIHCMIWLGDLDPQAYG